MTVKINKNQGLIHYGIRKRNFSICPNQNDPVALVSEDQRCAPRLVVARDRSGVCCVLCVCVVRCVCVKERVVYCPLYELA